MPTIIEIDGYRVVIYPNDHLPAHVHVFKAGSEVKVDIASDPPRPIKVSGTISNREIKAALELVANYRGQLLQEWKKWTISTAR